MAMGTGAATATATATATGTSGTHRLMAGSRATPAEGGAVWPATAKALDEWQSKEQPGDATGVVYRARPWRHLSEASWKFKGFEVPAGRLRPLTPPASERRAAQGWRPGVTPRHRKEQPGVKAAPGPGIVGGIPEAAAGGFPYSPFLENFGPRTLVAVRPLMGEDEGTMRLAG